MFIKNPLIEFICMIVIHKKVLFLLLPDLYNIHDLTSQPFDMYLTPIR
jgi:hypothetical protein